MEPLSTYLSIHVLSLSLFETGSLSKSAEQATWDKEGNYKRRTIFLSVLPSKQVEREKARDGIDLVQFHEDGLVPNIPVLPGTYISEDEDSTRTVFFTTFIACFSSSWQLTSTRQRHTRYKQKKKHNVHCVESRCPRRPPPCWPRHAFGISRIILSRWTQLASKRTVAVLWYCYEWWRPE